MRGERGGYSCNSSQPKKPRNDEDEEDTPNFEDHLAGLEDEDFMDCDFPASEAEGPEQQLTHQKWSRPNPPSLDPSRDKLVFQQVELDHYIGQARVDMPGAREGNNANVWNHYGWQFCLLSCTWISPIHISSSADWSHSGEFKYI